MARAGVVTQERRRAVRRTPAPGEPVARVRLRAGRELAVVNVSNGGLLVEGDARLLPGVHVDVHVTTYEGRVLVRSRIVRACVSALHADRVIYRGAFAFEHAVNTAALGEVVPAA